MMSSEAHLLIHERISKPNYLVRRTKLSPHDHPLLPIYFAYNDLYNRTNDYSSLGQRSIINNHSIRIPSSSPPNSLSSSLSAATACDYSSRPFLPSPQSPTSSQFTSLNSFPRCLKSPSPSYNVKEFDCSVEYSSLSLGPKILTGSKPENGSHQNPSIRRHQTSPSFGRTLYQDSGFEGTSGPKLPHSSSGSKGKGINRPRSTTPVLGEGISFLEGPDRRRNRFGSAFPQESGDRFGVYLKQDHGSKEIRFVWNAAVNVLKAKERNHHHHHHRHQKQYQPESDIRILPDDNPERLGLSNQPKVYRVQEDQSRYRKGSSFSTGRPFPLPLRPSTDPSSVASSPPSATSPPPSSSFPASPSSSSSPSFGVKVLVPSQATPSPPPFPMVSNCPSPSSPLRPSPIHSGGYFGGLA
uniref:Uncharacterized protein n=1 Tax=Polytomella parva TaxID=51329 RepID=A0A7S0YDM5_9CHLO|mmetsp:Transcript_20173/g.36263  ORF Transcript_20173/g.36263 Transcript_20173/m.36263 type:complete len:411 (+) Transcript_20173:176-1408(+)